jgi:MFS family permease
MTSRIMSSAPAEVLELIVHRAIPDPKSWSPARRWTIVVLLSVFTLISPMSSSMVAPALDEIARDIHIEADFTKQLVLSIFVLFYGIVPILIGPLSEQYGILVTVAIYKLSLLTRLNAR